MLAKDDELRHPGSAVEAWWWWGRSLGPDGVLGAAWFVGLELAGRRVHYWAGLARRGQPYLYVEDLDGTSLRAGLEIKPPEMWAGHDCDLPFRQWSLGNEAHGVLLDDPNDALERPFGDLAPVTFDIEWFSDSEPEEIRGPMTASGDGYTQVGRFDARIELSEGLVALEGPAERLHVWGVSHLPHDPPPVDDGAALFAPYRRSDGRAVQQAATPSGWWARTVNP